MNPAAHTAAHEHAAAIIPRADLDFDFAGDIPRHWFDGDIFKTRFMDALSTLFPEGERFFIQTVRAYSEEIEDPELAGQVRAFIFQEGQHGMQHDRYNQRLAAQGIDIDSINRKTRQRLGWIRSHLPRSMSLSITVAAEHLTAVMAHAFLGNRQIFADADPRMRALFFWHAVEEIEHKAVAYDVLTRVAKANYFTRMFGMLFETISFPLFTFLIMNHMFKVDGVKSRWKLWLRGLAWLYGPRGIMLKLIPHYLKYFLPGFHPWRAGRMEAYVEWQSGFEECDDPVEASTALMDRAG